MGVRGHRFERADRAVVLSPRAGRLSGSGCAGQSAEDVLVQAEVLLGGFCCQLAMEQWTDAEVELA